MRGNERRIDVVTDVNTSPSNQRYQVDLWVSSGWQVVPMFEHVYLVMLRSEGNDPIRRLGIVLQPQRRTQ